MAYPFTPLFTYVPDDCNITQDDIVFILAALDAHKEEVDAFGRHHIEASTVMHQNASVDECMGEGKPMITFTEIDWAHMSEEERTEYMEDAKLGTPPEDSFTSVRITMNDGYFAPMVEELFTELSQEQRWKVALFLRQSIFLFSHKMATFTVLKHKYGIEMSNAFCESDFEDNEE